MYKFNIIATYLTDDQDIFDIEFDENDVSSETTFLLSIFSELDEISIDSLIKLSICQFSKEEEMLPWVRARHGKYYFSDEDVDTQNLLDLRNFYISECKRSKNVIDRNVN